MLEIINVSKSFNHKKTSFPALKGINLTINQGDIFGIIGVSGAGKTTLIRCLSGLEKVTEGEIIIDKENINNFSGKQLRETRKKLGIVFQGYNLLMQSTVFQNVIFPLKINKFPKVLRKEKAEELIKLVGLESKRDEYPAKLSGGQKQRVAIARALAVNPKILLLDEPTSALDLITTKSIIELIKEINEKFNMTIVIITHQENIVRKLCNRVAVIDNGEIVESGNTEEIFTSPQCEVTKLLIGRDL